MFKPFNIDVILCRCCIAFAACEDTVLFIKSEVFNLIIGGNWKCEISYSLMGLYILESAAWWHLLVSMFSLVSPF
jgi:hypothetical protein